MHTRSFSPHLFPPIASLIINAAAVAGDVFAAQSAPPTEQISTAPG